MTASYMLVTAAAVVLVEVVLLGIVVPGLVSEADQPVLVPLTASGYADQAMEQAAVSGRCRPPASSGASHLGAGGSWTAWPRRPLRPGTCCGRPPRCSTSAGDQP
jgi:hypothetical protein